MPQTLLAIAAILLVASYSLTVQQRHVMSQRTIIAREMEEMAGSVALEVMEVVRSRAFDQAVLDSLTAGTMSDVGLFSYSNNTDHFTTGNRCSVFGTGTVDCDDIDDFHAMETATRSFVMGADSILFDVDIAVEYVDASFQRYDGRSFYKQVTVRVRDAWPEGMSPFLRDEVELSRVFSYDFAGAY